MESSAHIGKIVLVCELMAVPAPLARSTASGAGRPRRVRERRPCRHGSSCPTKPPTALTLDQIEGVLERRDGVVWVHLNATATPAKQWIRSCTHLPEPIREDLLETDPRTRLEPLRSAVVGVIGDTVAGADPDPWRLGDPAFLPRPAMPDQHPTSAGQLCIQARPGGPQWAVGKQLRRTPGLAASPRCSVDQRARDRVGAGHQPQRGRRPGRAYHRCATAAGQGTPSRGAAAAPGNAAATRDRPPTDTPA